MKRTKDFNRIYVDKLGGKEIRAVIEEPMPAYLVQPPEVKPEFLTIEFEGLDTNICPTVAQFRERKLQYATNCTYIDNLVGADEVYVVGFEEEILKMWPDLTSKIRLK